MADLNLTKACIHGMDRIRDQLWNRCLRETKEQWGSIPEIENDVVRQEGLNNIEALREKNTAKDAGSIAKATRRYSFEERLRGKMSATIEAQIPFAWKCNWSCTDIQRRAQELCLLLDPVLSSRKSRLLPFFPVSVVVALMDTIYREGAEKPSWWMNKKNISLLIKKSYEYMGKISGSKVTEKEEEYVSIYVDLVSEVVSALSPIFLKNETLYSLTERYRLLESAIVSRVNGGSKNDAKALYFGKEKAEKMLAHASTISPIVGAELSMFSLAQKVVLAVEDGKNLLDKFCYVDEREEGQFCIDPLILDVVYLLRDITATIKIAAEKENERITKHLLNVLAEKPKQGKHISFQKMFMLATVLMRGFNEADCEEEAMEENGGGGEERAPKLQPEVIVLDDEDDDATNAGTSLSKTTGEERKWNKDKVSKTVAVEKVTHAADDDNTEGSQYEVELDATNGSKSVVVHASDGKEDQGSRKGTKTRNKKVTKKVVHAARRKKETVHNDEIEKKESGAAYGKRGLVELVHKYYTDGGENKGGGHDLIADVFGSDEELNTGSGKTSKGSDKRSDDKTEKPATTDTRNKRKGRKRRRRW